jgi:Tol biopolymer transport system component
VAAVSCNDNLQCPVQIVDLTTGARQSIPGSSPNAGAASLAPDGAHLAQITDTTDSDRQALLVFDTTTGDTLLHVPYQGLSYQSGPPRWSPDGQWLFWNDIRGLEAWNIHRIQPQTIDVPGTDRVSMHVVGVAATG